MQPQCPYSRGAQILQPEKEPQEPNTLDTASLSSTTLSWPTLHLGMLNQLVNQSINQTSIAPISPMMAS